VSIRTTIVFLALLMIGILYLVVFEDLLGIGTRESRRVRSTKAIEVEAARVTKIRLERRGVTTLLERGDGDRWAILEPVRAGADTAAVQRMLHALETHADRLTSETRAEDDLSSYGLDPPLLRIQIWSNRGRHSLALGSETPAGERRFAKRDGSNEVFVVDGHLFDALDRPLLELRIRNVFSLAPYRVDRLSLRSQGREIVAVREGDGWVLESPLRDRADGSRLEEFLHRLLVLDASEFFDRGPVDLEVTGLDPPRGIVTLSDEEGRHEETLRLGSPVPEKPDLVFARTGDAQPLIAVEGSLLREIEAPTSEFRSRKLFDFRPADWQAMEFGEGANTLRVENRTEAFRITRPEDAPADAERVREVVEALADAPVRRYLADAVDDPARRGVDPGVPVRVELRDGTAASVRLGALDEDDRFLFAARSDGGPLLAVDADLLRRIPQSLLDLRSREVADVDLWDARLVRLERADRTYVAREEGFHLRLESPFVGPMDPEITTRLEEALRPLRAVRLVTDSTDDLAPFGLAAPSITLEVVCAGEEGEGPGRRTTIRFGSDDGKGNRFALVEGRGLVFTVAPSLVELLQGEWLDRRPIDADVTQITRLRIEASGVRRHLVLRDGEWEMREPEGGRVAPRAASELARALVSPLAERYLTEDPGAAMTGLDTPVFTVRADVERGTEVETVTLSLGGPTPDGGRFGRRMPGGRLFVVGKEAAARLREAW